MSSRDKKILGSNSINWCKGIGKSQGVSFWTYAKQKRV